MHWGASPSAQGRADFPVHDWALAQQGSLLNQLLDPVVLSAEALAAAAPVSTPIIASRLNLLLLSSITYGFAMLAMESGRLRPTQAWLLVTGLTGHS